MLSKLQALRDLVADDQRPADRRGGGTARPARRRQVLRRVETLIRQQQLIDQRVAQAAPVAAAAAAAAAGPSRRRQNLGGTISLKRLQNQDRRRVGGGAPAPPVPPPPPPPLQRTRLAQHLFDAAATSAAAAHVAVTAQPVAGPSGTVKRRLRVEESEANKRLRQVIDLKLAPYVEARQKHKPKLFQVKHATDVASSEIPAFDANWQRDHLVFHDSQFRIYTRYYILHSCLVF
jgi:hypothetical protein